MNTLQSYSFWTQKHYTSGKIYENSDNLSGIWIQYKEGNLTVYYAVNGCGRVDLREQVDKDRHIAVEGDAVTGSPRIRLYVDGEIEKTVTGGYDE